MTIQRVKHWFFTKGLKQIFFFFFTSSLPLQIFKKQQYIKACVRGLFFTPEELENDLIPL